MLNLFAGPMLLLRVCDDFQTNQWQNHLERNHQWKERDELTTKDTKNTNRTGEGGLTTEHTENTEKRLGSIGID